jgi:hypothetical protein
MGCTVNKLTEYSVDLTQTTRLTHLKEQVLDMRRFGKVIST